MPKSTASLAFSGARRRSVSRAPLIRPFRSAGVDPELTPPALSPIAIRVVPGEIANPGGGRLATSMEVQYVLAVRAFHHRPESNRSGPVWILGGRGSRERPIPRWRLYDDLEQAPRSGLTPKPVRPPSCGRLRRDVGRLWRRALAMPAICRAASAGSTRSKAER